MIAGSTVTVRLSGLPVPIGHIESLKVVYRSVLTKETVLTVDLADMTRDGDALVFTMSQEDSLLLAGKFVRSVVLLTKDGLRGESLPETVENLDTCYGEVLA